MFKEYSKVMGYTALTIVILAVVLGGVRLAGIWGENQAFKHSYQRQEAKNEQRITLSAQIAQIEADMRRYPERRQELEAQKRVLEIQLQTAQ